MIDDTNLDGKPITRRILEETLDDRFGRFRKEIDETFKVKFNAILTGQDKIVKILEERRIEDTIARATERKHGSQIENHEIRIAHLEQARS